MSARLLLVAAALATGCTTVQDPFTETYDASNLYLVQATLDQGAFSYQGVASTDITVEGRSWGQGRNEDLARERREGNSWTFGVTGQTLSLVTSSLSGSAGVDLDLFGPGVMDLDIINDDGRVDLSDVEGFHTITAERIDGERVVGDVDLYATEGDIDLEVWPYEGGVIRVETQSGDVDLTLPWGLEYDMQVWGDPDYEMIVEDMGWNRSAPGPAYFAGTVGRGLIRVDVYANGGTVNVRASR
ncbi:MAG: hypothetical protein H6741_09505 [Alphaproteobacteria bacterium]|nr:hypothetical protein [Alphaproteobacteria bacterium]